MSKKNATNPFRYRKPFQVFGNQDIVMWEYVPQPHKKALVYDDKEAAKRGVKYVRCEKCGAIFEVKRKNNKTVLCPDCQAEQKREKDRDRKRRQRERVKMGRNPAYWERRIHSELANSAKRNTWTAQAEMDYILGEQMEAAVKDIEDVLMKVERDMRAQGANGRPQMNDLYREKRYYELRQELYERCEDIWERFDIEISQAVRDAYEEALEIIEKEAGEAVGGDYVDAKLFDAKRIDTEQILNQTWRLDGKNFSDRIWANKEKMLRRMQHALADSIARGKAPWGVAADMASAMGVSKRDAFRLLRTEVAHAQNMAQTQKYKSYGFTHAKFLASDDCCGECHEHDGEVYTLEEIERLIPVHPNCTCSYILVKPEKSGAEAIGGE